MEHFGADFVCQQHLHGCINWLWNLTVKHCNIKKKHQKNIALFAYICSLDRKGERTLFHPAFFVIISVYCAHAALLLIKFGWKPSSYVSPLYFMVISQYSIDKTLLKAFLIRFIDFAPSTDMIISYRPFTSWSNGYWQLLYGCFYMGQETLF